MCRGDGTLGAWMWHPQQAGTEKADDAQVEQEAQGQGAHGAQERGQGRLGD